MRARQIELLFLSSDTRKTGNYINETIRSELYVLSDHPRMFLRVHRPDPFFLDCFYKLLNGGKEIGKQKNAFSIPRSPFGRRICYFRLLINFTDGIRACVMEKWEWYP